MNFNEDKVRRIQFVEESKKFNEKSNHIVETKALIEEGVMAGICGIRQCRIFVAILLFSSSGHGFTPMLKILNNVVNMKFKCFCAIINSKKPDFTNFVVENVNFSIKPHIKEPQMTTRRSSSRTEDF